MNCFLVNKLNLIFVSFYNGDFLKCDLNEYQYLLKYQKPLELRYKMTD